MTILILIAVIGTGIVLFVGKSTKSDEWENSYEEQGEGRTGKPVIKILKSAYPSNYVNDEIWESDSKNANIVGKWKRYIIKEANKPNKI